MKTTLRSLRCPRCRTVQFCFKPTREFYVEILCKRCKILLTVEGCVISMSQKEEKGLTAAAI